MDLFPFAEDNLYHNQDELLDWSFEEFNEKLSTNKLRNGCLEKQIECNLPPSVSDSSGSLIPERNRIETILIDGCEYSTAQMIIPLSENCDQDAIRIA